MSEQEELMTSVINLREKFSRFTEHWSPRIIVGMNNHQFKLVKFRGEFIWHDHAQSDEAFIVWDGEMTVHFPDGEVPVRKGEMIVIPKGIRHKTSAGKECQAILVEASGTINTGSAGGERAAPPDSWI